MPPMRISEVTWHTSVVFLSTLAVQASAMAVIALSGYVLGVEDFARLSVISTACIMTVAFLDLGLSLTTTKMYGDTGDEGHFRFAFAVRLLLIVVAAALGALIVVLGRPDIGAGIALGGFYNLWNGSRSTDQAMQDYRSFTGSSLVFAGLRLAGGLTTLWALRDPLIVAVALYLTPVAAIVFSRSYSTVRRAFQDFTWPGNRVLRYALLTHTAQFLFLSILYAPQFFIEAQLPAADVGRFGLIMTFTGPVSLLVTSVRNVLLPKMLGTSSDIERLLWSRKGAQIIGLLWLALMLGGAATGLVIELLYSHKYPNTFWPFLIFYAGFMTAGTIGLTSLSMHTQGVPHYAVIMNAAKLGAFIPLLLLLGTSLLLIVTITAVVTVLGEIALILILRGRMQQ